MSPGLGDRRAASICTEDEPEVSCGRRDGEREMRPVSDLLRMNEQMLPARGRVAPRSYAGMPVTVRLRKWKRGLLTPHEEETPAELAIVSPG